jgi:hypothetical protein
VQGPANGHAQDQCRAKDHVKVMVRHVWGHFFTISFSSRRNSAIAFIVSADLR